MTEVSELNERMRNIERRLTLFESRVSMLKAVTEALSDHVQSIEKRLEAGNQPDLVKETAQWSQ